MAFLIIFWQLSPALLLANPTGGEVVSGTAGISTSGSTCTINQTTDKAIINWNGFSINSGELTKFIQPSSTSAVLNRVISGNPSAIYGTLQANGKVFLINPNGILVGPSGVIDTNGFVGSTLDVSNADFLSGGGMTFLGDSSAKVQNFGKITAGDGDVFLFARQVENSGEITAKNGTVGIGAGTEILMQPVGDRIAVITGQTTNGTGIDQKGMIEAARAELKAAGGNVYALAINHEGEIYANATGAVERGGEVWLVADGGKIKDSGKITAKKDSNGGTVKVLAENIEVTSEATIDVSGKNGGGTVLMGGDYQGSNPEIPNAKTVLVEEGAQIKADAIEEGDGGKVIVWADETTEFHGNISATGTGSAGKGGFVEVSGKEHLTMTGHADLRGAMDSHEYYGTLLLDPGTVIINNNSGSGGPDTFGDDWITTQLGSGNLTIQTSAATGANGANENIIVYGNADAGGAVNITWSAATKFELQAGRLIDVRNTAVIENTNTSFGAGSAIVFRANETGATSGTFAGITLAGATVRSCTGDIEMYGFGGNTSNSNYGIYLNSGGKVISTGTGADAANITLKGTTGGAASNIGFYVYNGSWVTTVDGDVDIEGQCNSTVNNNIGIMLNGGYVDSSGVGSDAGKITLKGTSGGTYGNNGIQIYGGTPHVTSIDGDIDIMGYTNCSDYGNITIYIRSGAYVASYGTTSEAAKISLTATNAGTTYSNYGFYLGGSTSTYITSYYGDITINAKGGNGSGTFNYGFMQDSGAYISSLGTGINAAKINIAGTSGTGTNDNYGVYINAANTKITSIDGDITITGKGGGSGTSSNNFGIYMLSGGQVISTGTTADAAAITMTGTGGNGTNNNHGVYITGTNSKVTSAYGNISVDGAGGGNGSNTQNVGVMVAAAGQVSSTGTGSTAATITVRGTGGNGTGSNDGVLVTGASSKITSVNGDITVIGKGGTNTAGNEGVGVSGGGQISSTGTGVDAADITITGTGGTGGTTYNCGIVITGNNSKVTTIDGDIAIYGYGNNSTGSAFDIGVYVNGNGQIESTGTSGSAGLIHVLGVGGSGTGANTGLYLYNGAKITSAYGNMTIQGQGGGDGTGISNTGIYIDTGTQISSTGLGATAAKIFVTGTAGNGTSSNAGIISAATNGITSFDGDISVIGYGRGSAGTNYGIAVGTNGITSTGTGDTAANIILAGTGGNGTGSNHGVYVTGGMTTIDGDLSLTGYGGGNGSGGSNAGFCMEYACQIASTGTTSNAGKITIVGTGGNGSTCNGVTIGWSNPQITSNYGNISITGQAGTGGNGNCGVYFYNGGRVLSLGTGAGSATITIVGTGANSGSYANNRGIYFYNTSCQVASVDGDISLSGQGLGATAGNYGVYLYDAGGGGVLSTGSAKITLTGTGSPTGSDSPDGIRVYTDNASVQTIGGASAAGDITLTADRMYLDNATIRGNAQLLVQQAQVTTTVGLGGGAGTLNLSTTELGNIANGFSLITIGRTDGTGLITANAATWNDNVKLQSGSGGITIAGAQTLGANNLTLYTTGTFTQSAAITGAGLELLGAGTNYSLTNAGNNISTLAGNTGSVTYTDADGFAVGTVNTVGLTTTGGVTLTSSSGTVAINNVITAGGAVAVNIGQSAAGTLNLNADVSGSSFNVTGGAGNDAFNINVTSLTTPLTINAAGGTDTLNAPNAANTWNITGSDSGNLGGASFVNFSNVENLTGNNNTDNFVFSDGASVSGTIDGGAGSDTLNYSAYTTGVSVNLQANTATGAGNISNIEIFTGGSGANSITGVNAVNTWTLTGATSGTVGVYTFSNFQTWNGGSGADTLIGRNVVNSWALTAANAGTVDGISFTGMETLQGGTNTDTLTGRNVANTWNITGAGSGNVDGVNFSNMENYTGGTSTDNFVLGDGISVTGTINGGAGTDTLDYSAYTTAVSVNLQANTTTNIGTMSNIDAFVGGGASSTITGADAANTWNITGNNAGNVGGITFSAFKNLVGGSSTDNFVFSDGFGVTGSIDGGLGTNTLDYSAYTIALTINLVTGTATGTGGISNIQNVTCGSGNDTVTSKFYAYAQNLNGGAGTDTLNFDCLNTSRSSTISPLTATGYGDATYLNFETTNLTNSTVPASSNPSGSITTFFNSIKDTLSIGGTLSEIQKADAIYRVEAMIDVTPPHNLNFQNKGNPVSEVKGEQHPYMTRDKWDSSGNIIHAITFDYWPWAH